MDFFVQSKFALAAVYARPNPAGRLTVQRTGHMYRANVGGHLPFFGVIRELAEKRVIGDRPVDDSISDLIIFPLDGPASHAA
jgi:hypothetical protein